YKYGGVYTDMDIMFLRNMHTLFCNEYWQGEFCYRWSAHLPYGNSAVLRLRQYSDIAHSLLDICGKVNSCDPRSVLRFEENRALDLLVLPCVFFDPLWPHYDRRDRYDAAPFHSFKDFFQRFDTYFRRNLAIRSYRDFFPGAFAYHWHNCWNAQEHKDSYFGLFNQEFDYILRDRLDIKVANHQESDPYTSLL
ncbi:MAG TPA: glycosyltransferase, partial [Thermodesulfobacteriota bacterium]